MPKLSILIPSKNEKYLFPTVEDIYRKAVGDIEVIAVLDNYWPNPILKDHKTLTILHIGKDSGMRPAINAGASIATGKYLMKCDAHCMFAEGFDEELIKSCEKHMVMVPRRYSLDADRWEIKAERPTVDYHYLSFPYLKPEEIGMHGIPWNERAKQRKEFMIDDEMSSQGSCWCMRKDHFDRFLGGLSCEGYGNFVQEFQEIGMKTWLGGGRVVVNKNTWYAHLHKGKSMGRGYFIDKRQMIRGAIYSADFWMNNRWGHKKYPVEWLMEKFWPVPTWPADFLENPDKYRKLSEEKKG